MNPIDELRAARPAHLGDVPVDERTRAAELSYAMSRPRRARAQAQDAAGVGHQPGRRRGRGGGGRRRDGHRRQHAARTRRDPARTHPVHATPSTSSTAAPKVTLSAREVLLAAAENADRQPDRTAAYWHTASVSRTLYKAVDGGYLVWDRSRIEGWTPRATGTDQWSSTQSLDARPATEADEAAWRQAGSPAEIDGRDAGQDRAR